MTNTPSFVRTQMLDPKDPSLGEKGIVKWMRENLFSSVLNSVLTLLTLYVVYMVLSHFLPWALGGIWHADNLSQCREIRDASGIDHNVACWAVITDRWHQLLFGFYPSDQYWRPILTLVLLGVALAPVLFDTVPRKLFIFTLIFPFLAFWLLWGGAIWLPILVAAGLGLSVFAFIKGGEKYGVLWAIPIALFVFLLWFGNPIDLLVTPINWFLTDDISLVPSVTIGGQDLPLLPLQGLLGAGLIEAAPIGIQAVESREFGGFLLALVIGASGIILSMPLGIVLALGRQSDLFIINKSSVIFIEVIRGVPLIVWLFSAQLLLGYFLPPGTNFDLMLRVIIMVTLFSSAYIAEVIRGGLAALPRGQYEGADSLGLDYWQSMQLIILPQALKISIPGIVSSFSGLFNDTTLVVFIGMFDPLGFAGAIRADADWNGIYWELFVFIGLCFWVFCFSMSRYSQWLERKLHTGHS